MEGTLVRMLVANFAWGESRLCCFGDNITDKIGLANQSGIVVRLHFAEIYFVSGRQRIFDVKINDVLVLSSFDVWTEAGNQNKALVKDYNTQADANGNIKIEFIGIKDHPKSIHKIIQGAEYCKLCVVCL